MSNFKYLATIIFCLFTFCQLCSQNSILWSLEESIKMSHEKNLTLSIDDKQIEIAKTQKKLEQLGRLPSLTLNQDNNLQFGKAIDLSTNAFVDGTFFNSSGQVNLNVPLFQGGLISRKIKIADLEILMQKSNKDMNMLSTDIQVVEYYLKAFYYQQLSEISQKIFLLLQEYHQREKDFFTQHTKTITDTMRSYIVMRQAWYDVQNNKNSFYENMVSLLQFINYPVLEIKNYSRFYLNKPELRHLNCVYFFTPDLVDFSQRHPSVKNALLQKDIIRQKIRLEKSNLFPSINLRSGLGTVFSSNQENTIINSAGQVQRVPLSFEEQLTRQFNQQVGLSISFPVSSYFNISQRLKKLELEQEKLDFTIEKKKTEVIKEMMNYCIKLDGLSNKLENDTQLDSLQYTVLQSINEKYNVGVENWTNLYNAIQDTYKSELRVAESFYSYTLLCEQLNIILKYLTPN